MAKIEMRPPRLNREAYPLLHVTEVRATRAAAYAGLAELKAA